MQRMNLALLALFAVVGLLGSVNASETTYADIVQTDLKAAIAAKTVVLLDCNGTASYTKHHIPGALDFEAVKANLAKSLPAYKAALVVSYCGSPACNAYKSGAKAASDLGYTNVKHFADGIKGWLAANEPTEPAGAANTNGAACPSGCK